MATVVVTMNGSEIAVAGAGGRTVTPDTAPA